MNYTWSRKHGYEVSTKGDKRFSAYYAKINDKSIEEIYQLDIKGFRAITNDIMTAKGKPPYNNKSKENLYIEYKALWRKWCKAHPKLFNELRENADRHNGILRDRFASSDINQARILSELLNEEAPRQKLEW